MKIRQWIVCSLVTVFLTVFSSVVIGQNGSNQNLEQGSLENKAKKKKKQTKEQIMLTLLMKKLLLFYQVNGILP